MAWVIVLALGLTGLLLLALAANSPGLRLPLFMLVALAIITFFAMDPRGSDMLNEAYNSLALHR